MLDRRLVHIIQFAANAGIWCFAVGLLSLVVVLLISGTSLLGGKKASRRSMTVAQRRLAELPMDAQVCLVAEMAALQRCLALIHGHRRRLELLLRPAIVSGMFGCLLLIAAGSALFIAALETVDETSRDRWRNLTFGLVLIVLGLVFFSLLPILLNAVRGNARQSRVTIYVVDAYMSLVEAGALQREPGVLNPSTSAGARRALSWALQGTAEAHRAYMSSLAGAAHRQFSRPIVDAYAEAASREILSLQAGVLLGDDQVRSAAWSLSLHGLRDSARGLLPSASQNIPSEELQSIPDPGRLTRLQWGAIAAGLGVLTGILLQIRQGIGDAADWLSTIVSFGALGTLASLLQVVLGGKAWQVLAIMRQVSASTPPER